MAKDNHPSTEVLADPERIGRRMNDPVVQVSYRDALAYTGADGSGRPRNSTSATRGGLNGRTYVWGDEMKPDGRWRANVWQGTFPQQNTAEDGYAGIAPVGCFPPNGYDLYDMTGNVWKWTSSLYEGSARSGVPASRVRRTIKGGSFLCSANYCARFRSSARQPQEGGFSSVGLGFRTPRRCGTEGGDMIRSCAWRFVMFAKNANATTISADMTQAVSDHEARCMALGQADFSNLPDAGTQILKTQSVKAGADGPPSVRCGDPSGPSVRFKMGWPGRVERKIHGSRTDPAPSEDSVRCISHLVPVAFCLLLMSKTPEAQSLPADSDTPASAQCVSTERRNDRRLAFGMRGRIQRLAVSVGDHVKPGAVLARLDCNGVEADLQIAAAELEVVRTEYEIKSGAVRVGELEVAEARLRATQMALQDAEATQARLKKLSGNGGLVLQTELSEAARRWANAELDVAIAQNSVERIRNPLSETEHEYWRRRQEAREATVRRAQLQVRYCDLRAPAAGAVDEVLRYEGEFADAMEPVVVLRIEETVKTPREHSSRDPAHATSNER